MRAYWSRKLSSKKWPEGKKLDRDDYLIVAGDMGILWSNVEDSHEKHLKQWYGKKKPWTTLFVDGNHECHTRLNNLPTEHMFGGVVGNVFDNIYHLRRGEIYTIHGKTFFVMGGATSWDMAYRIIDISWWKEEIPNHAEFDWAIHNLENHNWEVDYVITHTMPQDVIPTFGFGMKNYKNINSCPVAKYLNHIALNLKFKEWYFGHFHDDKTKGRYHLLYDDIQQII